MNRECREEMNVDTDVVSFSEKDHVLAHLKKGHPTYGDIELHFYAKEITEQQFKVLSKC